MRRNGVARQALTRVKRIGFLGVAAALPLLGASAALPAGASSSSFSTPPAQIDRIASDVALAPGDVISVGMVLQATGPHNRAATLYLVNGQASIGLACTRNGPAAVILTIPLWQGPLAFPANYGGTNGGWFPTNQWSNRQTYQTATSLPDWCHGGPVYVTRNGETYAGALGSPDNTSDTFNIQLHTAVAAAAGGTANTNCGSASQNPSGGGGSGIKACNFNGNGSATGLTPERYSPPAPPPPPAPTTSATAAPTGSSGPPPSSGNVPIPVVFSPTLGQPPAPAGATATLVPVAVISPAPAPSTPATTAAPSASATPVPPVVINPVGPTAPAQLITAITTSWIPLAAVAGLLFIVIMAVLFTSRHRHRADPPA